MADVTLDARGLLCPLPVLKAQKILKTMRAGEVLSVLVTDAHSPPDFRLFCRDQGHVFLGVDQEADGVFKVTLACGAAAGAAQGA